CTASHPKPCARTYPARRCPTAATSSATTTSTSGCRPNRWPARHAWRRRPATRATGTGTTGCGTTHGATWWITRTAPGSASSIGKTASMTTRRAPPARPTTTRWALATTCSRYCALVADRMRPRLRAFTLPLLLAAAGAVAGQPAFSTSFETGEPSPAGRGDSAAGVRSGAGPATPYAAKPGVGYSGLAALRYEGAGGRVQLFEVDIPVEAATRLSWMVLPEIVDGDTIASTGVSLDLVFDDGR